MSTITKQNGWITKNTTTNSAETTNLVSFFVQRPKKIQLILYSLSLFTSCYIFITMNIFKYLSSLRIPPASEHPMVEAAWQIALNMGQSPAWLFHPIQLFRESSRSHGQPSVFSVKTASLQSACYSASSHQYTQTAPLGEDLSILEKKLDWKMLLKWLP